MKSPRKRSTVSSATTIRGKLLEHHAAHPLHEQQRKEHRQRGQRARGDRNRHFAGAFDRRLVGRHSAVAQPGDVFEHHDGVVHQHADAEGEAAKRHDIQCITAEINQCECRDDRHRNADADHHRAAQIAQEEEENHHRQQSAGHRGIGHPGDGAFDVVGRIDDRLQQNLVGVFAVDPLNLLEDLAGDPDRVGARLFVDLQHDSRLAVDPYVPVDFRMGVDHFGDVPQPDLFAVLAGGDHRVADLLDAGEDARGPDPDLQPSFDQVAGRSGHVGVLQDRKHIRKRGVELARFVDIEEHLNLPFEAAADVDRGDAVDPFDPVLDLIFDQLPGVHEVDFSGDADLDDR